ncbi:MAG: nitroreductase family protein [Marinifilaceae bacterium]
MKLRNILLKAILALALLALLLKCSNTDMKKDSPTTMEIIEARKCVRSYADTQVSKEDVNTLLKAAMCAPSARNIQPWEFIVVTDRAILDTLGAQLKTGRYIAQVNVAIIVAANKEVANAGAAAPGSWVMDCSAATQNILLAAQSLGLSTSWVGIYPYADRMETVQNILNLPDYITPLNVIPIGYGNGNEQPKVKWNEQKIHYNKW